MDDTKKRRLWAIGAGAFFAAYALTWWTSYVAPNNGNELFIMSQAAHGRLPYRDYFWVQPPAIPILVLTCQKLFGVYLLPFYVLSLVARSVAVGTLAWVMSRRRSPVVASLASASAAILSCNDDGEYIAHYSHWFTTFTVLLVVGLYPWFAGAAEEPGTEKKPAYAWLAGAASACMFLTKQTAVVLIGLVFLALVAMAIVRPPFRVVLRRFLPHALAGFALVLGGSVIWLAATGGLRAAVRATWIDGPSAKGGAGTALLRIVTDAFDVPILRTASVIGLSYVACFVVWALVRRYAQQSIASARGIAAFGLIAISIVLASTWSVTPPSLLRASLMITRSSIYVGVVGCLVLAVSGFVRVRQGGDGHRFLLAIVSFASAYGLSGSWGAMEFMLFPALAVAVTEAVDAFGEAAIEVRAMVVASFFIWIGWSAWLRYTSPYRWSYWSEGAVAKADYRAKAPALFGFTMHERTADFLDTVTGIAQAATRVDEPVFQYPHLLMLPALADRPFFGTTPMLFSDVCPDKLAKREAERLLSDPPPVLVYQDLPESIVRETEVLFRNGKAGGQRDVVESLSLLRSSGDFAEVATFSGIGPIPYRVLVRMDRLAAVRRYLDRR